MADIAEILETFYAAYAARDAGAAAELYPADGWHEEVAMGKRRLGRDSISDGLSGFFKMLPDVTWEEQERILSGQQAAVVYTLRGTFTPRAREPGDVPAPRPVVLKGMHLFEFSQQGLVGTKDYWNLDSFKQQIA